MSTYLANHPLLFGSEWLNPDEPVPEEPGRDYGAMLARGEIRLAASGNAAALQKRVRELEGEVGELRQKLTDSTAEAADLKTQLESVPPDTEDLSARVVELQQLLAGLPLDREKLLALDGIGPRQLAVLEKNYPQLFAKR